MTSRSYMDTPARDPSNPWAPSPFKRLARTHALSVAGDAMFTTAMASLVFLNVTNLNQARWQVAAALIFTILPFSLAAPFIGPLIDRARGGRKWMIVALSALRAVVCLLLVWDRDSQFFLYPEFLLALVFSKGYVVARGALVPATVHSDVELVEANSKLAAISGIAAVAGGGPSLLAMWIASKLGSDHGPDIALLLAAIVYVVSAAQAFQLPSIRVAEGPEDEIEKTELHSEGIRHAAFAISLSRGQVGFLTFMLALHFKGLEEVDSTASKVGLVGAVVGGQVGFMIGAGIAPRVRRFVTEEQMLMISLAVTAVVGLLTAVMSPIAGATILALAIGLASNTAKQSFDAIVQRDAPDANRGRAFAKFETRFQLVWVIGALIPIAITFNIQLGFVLIAAVSAFSLVTYFVGLRRAVADSKRRPSPLAGEPVLVEPQLPSRSFLRGRRPHGAAPTALDGADPTLVMAGSAVAVPYTAADPTLVEAAPGTGLFGESDAPIPSALADTPADGLFAVAAPDAPRRWREPGPPQPVLYDSASWLDEDDAAEGTVAHDARGADVAGVAAAHAAGPVDAAGAEEAPVFRPGVVHPDPDLDPEGFRRSPYAMTTAGLPQPEPAARRDPGPPSLVDPLPPPAPIGMRPTVPAARVRAAGYEHDDLELGAPSEAAAFHAGRPVGPEPARPVGPRGPGATAPAPLPAAGVRPAVAAPPAPGAATSAPSPSPSPPDAPSEQLTLMAPDGTYPDPPWRDAGGEPGRDPGS